MFLGIELGSTRIKAVLIDEVGGVLAAGEFDWENRLVDGVWTYDLEDAWIGVRAAFGDLVRNFKARHGGFPQIKAIGISAMMHGYLALDINGEPLAEFRTWRNTFTETEAARLTDVFDFNIPQRWSVAHLYRAVRLEEKHVGRVDFLTTLAGYVHYKLTGERVLGIGDASGMFPVDFENKDYNAKMLGLFDDLLSEYKLPWRVLEVLPRVLTAGQGGGFLTEEGARLLDPSGLLAAGVAFCPPEGDAGTGMVATNSVAAGTGNVSAGTSVFAMLVLEKDLGRLYPEIDVVVTPAGRPVAMVHCNNCTSDLDAWVEVFGQTLGLFGARPDKGELYQKLYEAALKGDADGGGLVACNYLSGEHITGFARGRPIFARGPQSIMNIENVMRTLIFSAVATLRIGLDILRDGEGIKFEKLFGHGGFFKTKFVGQKLLAGTLDVPVAVMESAGEGGAWGIGILAGFMLEKKDGETLENFLENKIFAHASLEEVVPHKEDVLGFEEFLQRYKLFLEVEQKAVEVDF